MRTASGHRQHARRQGRLLAALLAAAPGVRGILLDQPEVIAGAQQVLAAAGVADRCTVVGGDMFTGVPPGGDAYILTQILHGWADDQAVAVLRVCYEAMRSGARLWVVERVIPSDGVVDPSLVLFDLQIFLASGGQERTADEYRSLLDTAGFRATTVLPTGTRWNVVQAMRP